MSLKEGFNEGINNEEYHADRSYISSSGLKLLLKDPKEYYKIYVLNEKSTSSNQVAMDFGSYIHARILEPHLVDQEFAVYGGAMRKGEVYEEFLKTAQDKKILTLSQTTTAETLLDAFYKAEIDGNLISNYFANGTPEETLCGELDGVKIKVRFDYRVPSEFISDIKTTSKALKNKSDTEYVCATFDYDLSAALYVDMAEKYTGVSHDFYFCFLSKADGQTTLWKASKQMLEKGRQKYKRAIELLKKARESGIYWETGIPEIDSIEI